MGYSEERYVEIRDEMRNMLTKVGWKKDFVAKSVPVLPISGWMGDNLLKKSEKMGWWSGVDVETEKNGKVHVHTLKDALNDMVDVPQRETDKPLRLPISGIYKIKGRRRARGARGAGPGQARGGVHLPAHPHPLEPLRGQGVHRGDAPQARGAGQARGQRRDEHQGPRQGQH